MIIDDYRSIRDSLERREKSAQEIERKATSVNITITINASVNSDQFIRSRNQITRAMMRA